MERRSRTEPPIPYDPCGFRYLNLPFPPYRHLPGVTPHPRRHPLGHLFGRPESPAGDLDPRRWWACRDYLYGVDLFNFAYYWEAHEAWEGLWKESCRTDASGLFLQGLIQLSAALLKREQGSFRGMERLAQRGFRRLHRVVRWFPNFCGVDLLDLMARLQKIIEAPEKDGWPADPRIYLKGFPTISSPTNGEE